MRRPKPKPTFLTIRLDEKLKDRLDREVNQLRKAGEQTDRSKVARMLLREALATPDSRQATREQISAANQHVKRVLKRAVRDFTKQLPQYFEQV